MRLGEQFFKVVRCGVALAALALGAGVVGAQESHCTVKPSAIALGQTVRLRCDVEVGSAKLWQHISAGVAVGATPKSDTSSKPSATAVAPDGSTRTVRMFKQADGSWEGLMPVAVMDATGGYWISFLREDGTRIEYENLTVKKTIFPTQNVTLAPSIEALHSTPDEMKTLVTFRDAVSDTKYWEEPLVAPLPGCVISPFGVARLHNGKPTGEFHGGIDQRGALGTPIHAAAAGVVKIVQPFNVLGGTVAIDHGQGLETMYLHMSKLNVAVGDHVAKGDVIGYVGATGRANGPHLHWVVYVNGVPQNPQQWVTGLKACGAGTTAAKSAAKKK